MSVCSLLLGCLLEPSYFKKTVKFLYAVITHNNVSLVDIVTCTLASAESRGVTAPFLFLWNQNFSSHILSVYF